MGQHRGTERGTRNMRIGKRSKEILENALSEKVSRKFTRGPSAAQRKLMKKMRTRKRRYFQSDEIPSL